MTQEFELASVCSFNMTSAITVAETTILRTMRDAQPVVVWVEYGALVVVQIAALCVRSQGGMRSNKIGCWWGCVGLFQGDKVSECQFSRACCVAGGCLVLFFEKG